MSISYKVLSVFLFIIIFPFLLIYFLPRLFYSLVVILRATGYFILTYIRVSENKLLAFISNTKTPNFVETIVEAKDTLAAEKLAKVNRKIKEEHKAEIAKHNANHSILK